jgi:hypothetical protein
MYYLQLILPQVTYDSLRSDKNILWERLGEEESDRKGEEVGATRARIS